MAFNSSRQSRPSTIVTMQPTIPKGATSEQYPDGWTACLVDPCIVRQIHATPGFPRKLQRPPKKNYEIRPVDGKGLAMFATEDIDVGELIVCERPLVLVQTTVDLPDQLRNTNVELSEESLRQAVITNLERRLESLVDQMDAKFREQYLALVNAHHDGSGPLLGRLRTNGFASPDFDIPDGGQHRFSFVSNEMSRVNHSCCPNSEYSFDMSSFGMELRATRLIAKGTEISISYCDQTGLYSERQEALVSYDFTCDCPACKDHVSSDRFRKLLGGPLERILSNRKTTLDEVLRWIKRIEDFGLESTWAYVDCLQFVEKKYQSKGKKEKVKYYRNKAYKHTLAIAGKAEALQSMILP
ncbi:hypothetical protein C8Q75DRAFT_722251 [Abortiporus biennis]|nr:hypothetical protein C8Q75DRAFT_722251 [Abortiporus biennis]